MDWQAGDLALCIKQGRWRSAGVYMRGPKAGAVLTVRRVGLDGNGFPTIWLIGWHGDEGADGFNPARFRKIRPHTPDAEDRETIRLLNKQPATEDA